MRYLILSIIIYLFIGCTSNNSSNTVNLPSWYLNSPQNTSEFIYGVGESNNLKESKMEALRDMSEKLIVKVNSSYNTITKSSYDGINKTYNKNIIKDLKIETKKITFSNYKIVKSKKIHNDFYTLLKVNKNELFYTLKNEFDLIDANINSISSTLLNKSALEQIYTLNNNRDILNTAKNKALILYSIKNNFNYQVYFKKYDDLLNKKESLKNNLNIKVISNTKNSLYKEHLISLLNKNNYKDSNNSNNVIVINNIIRYSKALGWDIAKVSSTISIKSNNKNLSNHTINTIGRSSSSKENALISSANSFNKKLKTLSLNKLLFGNDL